MNHGLVGPSGYVGGRVDLNDVLAQNAELEAIRADIGRAISCGADHVNPPPPGHQYNRSER